MSSISFIELTTVVMVALVMLMVIVTISLKALRYLKVSWYERHYKRIEPALEKFILTGEAQQWHGDHYDKLDAPDEFPELGVRK